MLRFKETLLYCVYSILHLFDTFSLFIDFPIKVLQRNKNLFFPMFVKAVLNNIVKSSLT